MIAGWNGNLAVPIAGSVTDGHLIFPLATVDPSAWGVLTVPAEGEYGVPPRRVSLDRVWAAWDALAAAEQVTLEFSRPVSAGGKAFLEWHRQPGGNAFCDPGLWMIVRAAVAFDRVTQAGGPLSPLVAWQGVVPVAALMPIKPLGEWHKAVRLLELSAAELARPAATQGEVAT